MIWEMHAGAWGLQDGKTILLGICFFLSTVCNRSF